MPHSKNDKHSQYLRRKDFVWRPPKVSRKEREYRVYREEILSAAEKVFAAKGFFPITMSDIAREAEFGMGTLYAKFGGGFTSLLRWSTKNAKEEIEQWEKNISSGSYYG